MSTSTTIVTYLLVFGVVISWIFIIFSIVNWVAVYFEGKNDVKNKSFIFFRNYAYYIALFIAVASLISSLFYSEIVGFPACTLCIVQRFFFYPQILILGAIFLKKEYINKNIYKIILALSIIGLCIAGYHYYGQVINPDILSCDVVDGKSTCASIPFKIFGYITIPMMSLTGFAVQIVLMIWYKLSSEPRV